MFRVWPLWVLLLLVACGSDSEPQREPTPAAPSPEADGAEPVPPVIDEAPDVTDIPVPTEAVESVPAYVAEPLPRPTYEEAAQAAPRGLLPKGVTPLSYALELIVIPEQDFFSGHVDIAVRLDQPTDVIFMHGKSLDVSDAVVVLPDGKRVGATYTEIHADGVVRLDLERTLDAGNVVLEFDYTAPFGRLLHGLYKVSAAGADYVFTQMESVFAREAFPSFDEPAFKTPFELTLVIRPEHEAVANMPALGSELMDGMKRVRFAASPPMPTYLFAVAVGPLDIVEDTPIAANTIRSRPLPFRGVAVRGEGQRLAYAMRETGAILEAMENYFGSPYPFAKLDIIAVPDFEAGAMENTGAITFRDRLLLLDDDAPPQQRRAFASVMAHELAHMWFGNLVTIRWWDDLWLKESFATWMSYKAVQAYDADQKPYIAQLRRSRAAMNEDSLTSARQIREPVDDNDGIAAAFDGITYSKGGAVLRMFEHYLTEQTFRRGVRGHIDRFRQGSATVHDLIHSLSAAAGRDLEPAARSFLYQNGVPLVEARLDCEQRSIELAQARFLPIGSRGDAERLWHIPLCMKSGRGDIVQEQCVLLTESTQSLALDSACPDWIMPNADFAGYFRWLLPATGYDALFEAGDRLNEKEWLSVADSVRAGFESGRLDVEATWSAIERLSGSAYASVARSMLPTIRYLEETVADDPKLRWTIRGRAGGLYSSLQAYRAFDSRFLETLPDNETRILYSDVASFMAETAYDQPTRSAALDSARAFIGNADSARSVSRATLDTILTVGVQDGGQAFVDALYERFRSSTDSWFRDTALSALARSRDPEFGQTLRDAALGGELRSNEIVRLFGAHVQEDVNVWPTWDWLKTNIDELIEVMPEGHVPRLARIAERVCDQQYAEEFDEILRPRLAKIPGGQRRLDKSLERLAVCAAAVSVQRPQARAFFNQGVLRR